MSLPSALNIAKTGLRLNEINTAIESHNLSAQGVMGYKRQYPVAQDIGYTDVSPAGSSTSSTTFSTMGIPIGLGVKMGGVYRSFSQGEPIITENPLDVMIQGKGFFQIQMPDGSTGYTRAGVLGQNAQGQITTVEGYQVLPVMTIPTNAESLSISSDGIVQVTIAGQQAPQQIGQIQLATFINPNGLRAVGKNAFLETQASGTPNVSNPEVNGTGSLMQGLLESSNVNPIEAITNLIKIQHAYEHLTKVVSTADAMYEAANRMSR